jgi:N-acetyl-1-D-myo-inositol-2-amino-2-deoxy-alpha-D-glucopyranoside deacetylase
MAKHAAAGDLVTLVTCTLGEEGEILVPELEHLASDREDGLGQHRVGELAAAMEALRVTDHRFLGGPGRWRDSGMMGTPPNARPDTFWQADLGEAVRELVAVVRETRPQVVVTYDSNGGYGHPDHIQAHRVTVAAFDAAGDPAYAPELGEPWQASKLYFTAIPKSVLQAGIEAMREAGSTPFAGVASADDLPFGNPDDEVTTEVDASDHVQAKVAAMRAHKTQIAVDGPFFALSNGVGQKVFGTEHFVLARGERGPGDGPHGREDDLFAGLV